MKIEKINDRQIRCTISKEELDNRNISIEELVYGKDNAKDLFQVMMEQAKEDFGFEINDKPIVVEAFPDPAETVTFVITRIDVDPDSPEADKIEDAFKDVKSFKDLKDNLLDRLKKYDMKLNDFSVEDEVMTPDEEEEGDTLFYVYTFNEIEEIIAISKKVNMDYYGYSSLYKSPEDGKYYLCMVVDKKYTDSMKPVLAIFNECSQRKIANYAKEDFYREHFETIINEKAIDRLAQL